MNTFESRGTALADEFDLDVQVTTDAGYGYVDRGCDTSDTCAATCASSCASD